MSLYSFRFINYWDLVIVNSVVKSHTNRVIRSSPRLKVQTSRRNQHIEYWIASFNQKVRQTEMQTERIHLLIAFQQS